MADIHPLTPFHTIVFVAHGGPLEAKSALLAASLSINYVPKKISCCLMEPLSRWGKISTETELLFDQLGISTHYARNEVDESYPHGNKIASMAPIDGPALFLDSDVLLMKPLSWNYQLCSDFASKPADLDTYTRGGGQWSAVYDLFDLHIPPRNYNATTTGEMMRPYFNAGVISVKNGRAFTDIWVEASQKIDSSDLILNKRPWLDQISLPVAIDLLGWETTPLTEKFNYPCHIEALKNSSPYFAHYHRPHIIKNDPLLHKEFSMLTRLFPSLKTIMSKYEEWNVLL